MVLPAGALIDAKYRVVRMLGRGGMGEVYEVENVLVRRSAALKLLPPGASAEIVGRFEAEAQAAGRAGSKRIVDVLDLGRTAEGQPYLVMELLEGETLRDELRRARRLPPRRAASLVADVLRGLEAAHAAGIVHRDLKPENVWVLAGGGAEAPDAPLVKILDFGVSKFTSADAGRPPTAEGVMIGTCWYMSPEQIRDARRADARSDVYAAGVILYELLAGNVPFPGASMPELVYQVINDAPRPLVEVAPQTPEALSRVAMRALAKDPDARYPSAAAMREALAAFAEGRAPSDDSEGPQLDLEAAELARARRAPPAPELPMPPPAAAPPVPVDPPAPLDRLPSPGPPPPSSSPVRVPETPPSLPTPMPAASTRSPGPAPPPISLAEPLPAPAARVDDGWPRPPLIVGALSLAVILVSLAVGALYRAGAIGS